MTSVLSRFSEASATSLMCAGVLSSPACLPVAGSSLNPNLVAITTCLRNGLSASPTSSSFVNGPVHLGSVEELDAALDGRPDQGDRLLLVHGLALGEAHAHAGEPDGRHFQVAVSESTLFHWFLLSAPIFV